MHLVFVEVRKEKSIVGLLLSIINMPEDYIDDPRIEIPSRE